MKQDVKILTQLKRTEQKYIFEIQRIFNDLNKVSIIIGQVQENLNDFNSIDQKFNDLNKMFKEISRTYHNKKRRLVKLQETRRVILDNLYKKYPKSKIDELLKKV